MFLKQVFFLFLLVGYSFGQSFYGSTNVKIFREGRDKEMRSKEESPLLEKDFLSFRGLNNFSYSEKFRVTAKYTMVVTDSLITILTSSGKTRKAVVAGIVKFKLNNVPLQLNVYKFEDVPQDDEFKDLLFIPFKDLTNGKETYSGGRYIDIWQPKSSDVILDFNLAYNPNCAYGNNKYSCPIPPKSNFLKMKILAGEKKFVSLSGKSNH